MNVKNIRTVDYKGRVILPSNLMKLCKFFIGDEVAICQEEDRILICKLENSENIKISRVSQIDKQRRVKIFSKKVEAKEVEVYVLNGNLMLEEAH